jgi:hypothetical protein
MVTSSKLELDGTMEVLIENGTRIGEIRKNFSRFYPYLKIELFKTMVINGNIHKDKLGDDFQLVQKNPLMINVSKNRSIASIKKDFLEYANLIVKVLRKSGNVWVEISHTDHWPLEQQNSEGEQMNQ